MMSSGSRYYLRTLRHLLTFGITYETVQIYTFKGHATSEVRVIMTMRATQKKMMS